MKRTNSSKQLRYICTEICRYATCIACIHPFFNVFSFEIFFFLLDWGIFLQHNKNGRNTLLSCDISLKFGSIGICENTSLAINDCASIHIDFFLYIIVTWIKSCLCLLLCHLFLPLALLALVKYSKNFL